MSIKNESVQGDLSVSRNITAGGKFQSRGNATFDHDVQIKGWLEVSNLKDVCKGLYATEDALKAAYPRPTNGWFAYVGDTLPADVYRAENGAWVKTGQKGGETNIYLDEIENDLESLRDDLNENVGQIQASSSYVTCTTGAGTAAKTVPLSDFALSTGIRLVVKMSYANTAASATLNVNNTGAKTLYYNGAVASADNTWEDGETLDVYYDGTNYQASNVLDGSGSGGNMILEWDTDAATTRLQVKQRQRKKGMSVTYVNDRNETVNEQYIKNVFTDNDWKSDSNWVRYSMYKDARIREVRSGGFRLNFHMEVPAEKFGTTLLLPVKCIKGHKYALYIETEYDTKHFWVTMNGIAQSIQDLYPLNDCNGRNGYMWEFDFTETGKSDWNGEMTVNENQATPTGVCHIYMYDLTQDVTTALDRIGALESKQYPLMYKPLCHFEKELKLDDFTSQSYNLLITLSKQNYGELQIHGWQKNSYNFTNYDVFKNDRKYIYQVSFGKNDSIVRDIWLDLQYANGAWENGNIALSEYGNPVVVNAVQLPGYVAEFTTKPESEKGKLTGIKVSISFISHITLVDKSIPFKLTINVFEVYDNWQDLLKEIPIIKRLSQSLNIPDVYEKKLVETYKITSINPTDLFDRHPFDFGFSMNGDRVKMYLAKFKTSKGVPLGVTNVRAVYRYDQGNGVYKNEIEGLSSVINVGLEAGEYVFEALQDAQVNGTFKSPNHIEVALSTKFRNTDPDITVEIYEIRVKSNIYDGSVCMAYPIDRHLPVGLTRLDLTSEDITVKADHTLSGIPAENVDFKYTFDNGKVFTCKAEVDYQGASSLRYKKKNLKMDLLDDMGEAVELRIGTWLPMDSFHFKANYVDSTHCRNIIASRVMEQIYLSRGERPWDAYNDYEDSDLLKRVETGAMGHVDGFPIEIYVNNEYIGLYTFNLNKHRSNFNMKKSNTNQIQIQMGADMTWQTLPVKWNVMEIRSPKSDSGNEEFSEGVEPNAGEVKTAIERFATFCNGATLAVPTYTKDDFKDYLNLPFWIDFILFCDFTGNWDAYTNNTMMCTWDGLHWSPLVYDMDSVFGTQSGGANDAYPIMYSPYGTRQAIITKIIEYFNDDLIKRYLELRANGIFSVGNINKLVSDFMVNIGEAGYEKEQELWPNSPSNGGNSSYVWYDGKQRILSFVKGKILHMDLKYGLIQSRWY